MSHDTARRSHLRVTACFIALLILLGLPQEAFSAPERRLPALNLKKNLRGKEAVSALGTKLAAVARAHGMSPHEMRKVLLNDRSSGLQRKGRMFYTDRGADKNASAATAPGAGLTIAAAPSIQDAFLLHSRPGAKRVLFLDFDGHVITGSAWNSDNGDNPIVAPAWDIEGGPAVFTDTEKLRIVQIWQRVAEDYAPFDVDVTTEYPGEDRITRSASGDEYYGMRVLISPLSYLFGNYGGYAYVGVFNSVGDFYKPALVFPEKLANAEKYIAEACSHEAGHTFGLNHDGKSGTAYYQGHGSGETGWAPIMGNGYYQNLTQWSKGEYSGANNTQDDFAIIQTRAPLSPDDHGNTLSTATALPAGTQPSASGRVGSAQDIDMFKFFSGPGTISIEVLKAERGPNLDIQATLYDNAGATLLVVNPADFLNASFSLQVGGGIYFIGVRGTGKGDPTTGYSTYGSLGNYSLSAIVPAFNGEIAPVALLNTSAVSGDVPLTVNFDASASYDADGSISSYAWSFGDGTTGSGALVSHTYTNIGVYQAQLTVTDNNGLQTVASTAITVRSVNIPPSASFITNVTSGEAPVTVSFDASGSADSDGSITEYRWNFGDGTNGSGRQIQHTYSSAGTFTAVLTVVDDRQALHSASTTISVQPGLATTIRVAAIAVSSVSVAGGRVVEARVTVTNLIGAPMSGVSVSGSWSGAITGSGSATTGTNGVALIRSKKFKKSGTVTFKVNSLAKSGLVYDPSKNLVVSGSAAPRI